MEYTIAYSERAEAFPAFCQGEFENRKAALAHLTEIAGGKHTPHRLAREGRIYFGRVMATKDFKEL